MSNESKEVQGDFTLELPKDGDGPEVWTIHLKSISEDIFIAAQRLFEKRKDVDAMRFLIRNLSVGGDKVDDVCDDWKAIYASAEQIMELLPQARATLKKNSRKRG